MNGSLCNILEEARNLLYHAHAPVLNGHRARRKGRLGIRLFPLWLLCATPGCLAQHYFVTAIGGVSTLSADSIARLDSGTAASFYSPENGPALNLAAGLHLNNWISLQANYMWNRNDLTVSEIAGTASVQQDRRSSQNAGIADALLYFRPLRSRIRPYLSAGSGFVRLRSTAAGPARGELTPVPPQVDAVKLPLRVAVGIDVMLRSGWGIRYSFSETITTNPLSATLNPPGLRRLANFQNLVGFVKYF